MILLSPAKTFRQPTVSISGKKPPFEQMASKVRTFLDACSNEQLMKILHLKESQIRKVRTLSQGTPGNAYDLYNGIAFRAAHETLPAHTATDKLYILSAMYGILTADSRIHPYRLDMHASTQSLLGCSLLSYWQQPINGYILAHRQHEAVIDLTSQEFSILLDPKLCGPVVRVDFLSRNPSSVLHKRLRGGLAASLAKQSNPLSYLTEPGFHYLDYYIDWEQSKKHHLYLSNL